MGATAFWTGNGENLTQTDSLTVGGSPAAGNTITATVGIAPNTKSLTYTLGASDTTSTAAAALQALLASSNAPPEFQEITWSVANNVITGVAQTIGMPFTLSSSATGGVTLTHAVTQANVSQSDLINPANWLRLGVQAIPQDGDDVVIQDSTVPILWNLDGLKNVKFASYTRWNSMSGQIGLPEQNANGYYEYRPTYLQFSTTSGNICQVLLGANPNNGSGPALERYNFGNIQVAFQAQPTGSAIRLLSNNAQSTFVINNATVDIATLPTETSNTSGGITLVNGATLTLGPGVTMNGTLTVNSASIAFCGCNPATISANQGTVTVNAIAGTPGTVTSVTAQNNSVVSWLSNSNIQALVLKTSSTFDKSGDTQPVKIALSSMESTCQINDPWNAITFQSATVVNGPIQSGLIVTGPGRTLQVV